MSLKVRVGCALFQKNTSLLHEEKKMNEENTGEAFAIWLIKLIKDRTKKKKLQIFSNNRFNGHISINKLCFVNNTLCNL